MNFVQLSVTFGPPFKCISEKKCVLPLLALVLINNKN